MYDAGPFNWVGRNIEYVLALLDSSKQIFPRVNFNSTNGVTRANVPQTTLAIDSGATIHFFSNPELLKLIREIINKFTVHCGGKSFQHGTMGQVRDDLRHLPLPKGEVCLFRDGVANLLSMSKLPCTNGFRY